MKTKTSVINPPKLNAPKFQTAGAVIDIKLKSIRDQKIFIGQSLINVVGNEFKSLGFDKVVVFADLKLKKVHQDYLEQIVDQVGRGADVIYIKASPHIKDFSFLKKIIGKLIDVRVNRGSAIVAIGGGTLIDLVGFVASLYMRGVAFIAIPTTFMAQCDTVIGKVGINYKKHKHLLGSFYSPALTFCDSYFLQSVEKREVFNGLVEVWKHALLTRDKHLLEYFSTGNFEKFETDPGILKDVIASSILVKKSFVEKDFLDLNGKHAALSLGHTFANYLEGEGTIRHGEAILVGTIFCTFLSRRAKLLSEKETKLILETSRLFLKVFKDNKAILKKIKSDDTVLGALRLDKINKVFGRFNFVVPTNKGYTMISAEKEKIKECLKLLKGFLTGSVQA